MIKTTKTEGYRRPFTTRGDSPQVATNGGLNPNPNLNPNPIPPSEEPDRPAPPKKTHPRLEIFLQEYQQTIGREYVICNFAEHGGAAKRTIGQIPDDSVYRQAVRAYLAARDKRIVEASYPYLWFIRELNRWVSVAQNRGTHGTNNYTGFSGKDYSEGTW